MKVTIKKGNGEVLSTFDTDLDCTRITIEIENNVGDDIVVKNTYGDISPNKDRLMAMCRYHHIRYENIRTKTEE